MGYGNSFDNFIWGIKLDKNVATKVSIWKPAPVI